MKIKWKNTVQSTISLFIWRCVINHGYDEWSSLLADQGFLADIFLKIHDAWHMIIVVKVLGPLTAKLSPYFTVFYSSFDIWIHFLHNTYLWWLPAKSSLLASSDHGTQFQSMCQQHLANPRHFNLFLWNSRGFLMAILPNSFLASMFWQIGLLVFFWSWQDRQNTTNTLTVYFVFFVPN